MTAGPVTQELPFSARHFLDRLKALDVAPRGQKGLHRTQTEKLVHDLITEVGRAQKSTTLALTARDAAREALKYHADEYAAERQPYDRNGSPPTLAIDALVEGQQAAERNDRAANAEIARRLAAADRAQREAEELRERARESIAAERPTLVLPDEPKVGRDSLAGQAKWVEWIEVARDAVATHRVELAEWEEKQAADLDEQQRDLERQEQELVAQQGEVVANIDRHLDELPKLRDRAVAVDLTDQSAPEGEGERVAS
jgi:hypothetical protein